MYIIVLFFVHQFLHVIQDYSWFFSSTFSYKGDWKVSVQEGMCLQASAYEEKQLKNGEYHWKYVERVLEHKTIEA